MTPEERRLLTDLATKISQTPAPPRDLEAEDFIRKNIGNRPDALYLMTQTVLIQNMAIQQAQAQIRDLQQRTPQQPGYASSYASPAAGSFLGGQQQPQYGQPQYAQPQYAAPSSTPPSQGSGPGFLRGAAQTAAGVAAGALAFEGIRSLFEHPGYGGGFGQAGFTGGMPGGETVVNNYYDSPGQEERGGDRLAGPSDAQDYQNNQNDDAQVQNADYQDSNGDDSNYDDSSNFDDSSDVA